jgi:hypothetical protein
MLLLESQLIFVLFNHLLKCLLRLWLDNIWHFAFVEFRFAGLYLHEDFWLDGVVVFGVHFFHFEFVGLLAKEIVLMGSWAE